MGMVFDPPRVAAADGSGGNLVGKLDGPGSCDGSMLQKYIGLV